MLAVQLQAFAFFQMRSSMKSRIDFSRCPVDSWPRRLKISIPKRPSVILRALDEPLPLVVSRTGFEVPANPCGGLEIVARTGTTSRGSGLGDISFPSDLFPDRNL